MFFAGVFQQSGPRCAVITARRGRRASARAPALSARGTGQPPLRRRAAASCRPSCERQAPESASGARMCGRASCAGFSADYNIRWGGRPGGLPWRQQQSTLVRADYFQRADQCHGASDDDQAIALDTRFIERFSLHRLRSTPSAAGPLLPGEQREGHRPAVRRPSRWTRTSANPSDDIGADHKQGNST